MINKIGNAPKVYEQQENGCPPLALKKENKRCKKNGNKQFRKIKQKSAPRAQPNAGKNNGMEIEPMEKHTLDKNAKCKKKEKNPSVSLTMIEPILDGRKDLFGFHRSF